MGVRLYVDNASTTLVSSILSTDTSFDLTDASAFGSPSGGDWVTATLDDGAGVIEIIYITAIATNTITCTRGQEGTTAVAWAAGDTIESRLTAAAMEEKLNSADYANPTTSAGTGNTIVGSGAGAALASGSQYNALFGYQAGNAITTGDYNVCIGYQAALLLTTPSGIVAIGQSALDAMTTASSTYTVAVGYNALTALTSGTGQCAVGYNAGAAQVTASDSTWFGYNAGGAITGGGNTAIGTRTMASGTATRFNCVAIGVDANQFGTGNNTVNIGATLCGRQNGSDCVSIGLSAGRDNTGAQNVFIGSGAGYGDSSGDNNIVIGYNARKSATTAANEITLGNSSHATLRCQQTSITALSDRRDKQDIIDLPLGLDFIESIRPVKFTWNTRDKTIVGKVEAGFIAQELQEAAKNGNAEWVGLVLDSNPEKLEATPGKLLPILVKAIQELSERVKGLEANVIKC